MCGYVESYCQIRFSILGSLQLHFFLFFFFKHLHLNRWYHVSKCFSLLNTWKVYFRLLLGVWKPLARHYFACNHSHHFGKILPAALLAGRWWCTVELAVKTSLETSGPALVGLLPSPWLWERGLVEDFSLDLKQKCGVFGFHGWPLSHAVKPKSDVEIWGPGKNCHTRPFVGTGRFAKTPHRRVIHSDIYSLS